MTKAVRVLSGASGVDPANVTTTERLAQRKILEHVFAPLLTFSRPRRKIFVLEMQQRTQPAKVLMANGQIGYKQMELSDVPCASTKLLHKT